MRLRSRIIVSMLIALVGLGMFFAATSKSAGPVTVSVVSVAELEDTKRVTVEFLQREPAAVFAATPTFQIRVAGRWRRALKFLTFEDRGYLFDRTNRQRFVLDLPRDTDACRVALPYYLGSKCWLRTYSCLSRHGLSEKFPRISESILKHATGESKLRRVECELDIPSGRHNLSLEPTAAALCVCYVGGRFAAPALHPGVVPSGCGSVRRWAYVH
jgi:hypothetical protein